MWEALSGAEAGPEGEPERRSGRDRAAAGVSGGHREETGAWEPFCGA